MKVFAETLHITESLTRLGGVETLVRQLANSSVEHHAAGLLDSQQTSIARGVGLRGNKLLGAKLVRLAARRHYSHARHLVFHNFAGIMMLSSAIPHDRKCLFLHTNSADVFELLPERLPYLDTIIVSGDDLKNELCARFPKIRVPITAVEYPIDERYFSLLRESSGNTLKIGFSGRLEIEQKQVLRLRDLCQNLTLLGVRFQLEIAGSGSAMELLKKQLPAQHCKFLGALQHAEMHDAYKRWDFLICTSDYETGPLVAMEAMACGVIPILPDIHCQATALIADLDLETYRKADMEDAAHRIKQLSNSTNLSFLRDKLREKVFTRRLTQFVKTIDGVLANAAALPALGITPEVPRGLSEYLPFSLRKSDPAFLR